MTSTLQPYHPETAEPPVRSLVTIHELDVTDVIARIVKIQQVMKQVMREGEHYGVIPGATKPSLLKPGAELLCMVFRLDPEYGAVKTYDGDHLNVDSTCTLFHIPTSYRMGSGMGSCSTKEGKYKYRTAKRCCPLCEAEAILKSKFPPKDKALGTTPGWYCFGKQGGCGAEYAVNDGAILNQPIGQILNPDLPSLWNTVTKMSNKRALIAGVLNVTAASDIFTQDIEDYPEMVKDQAPPKKGKPTPAASAPADEREDEAITDSLADPEVNGAWDAEAIAQPVPPQKIPRKEAPLSEWLGTMAVPTTPARLEALWKDCLESNAWRKGDTGQKQQLIAAKDEAKVRLGIK